jgi:hypothetical protein
MEDPALRLPLKKKKKKKDKLKKKKLAKTDFTTLYKPKEVKPTAAVIKTERSEVGQNQEDAS